MIYPLRLGKNHIFNNTLGPEDTEYIDIAIDNGNFLRLSVDHPVVYHIGNQISEKWLMAEYERLTQSQIASEKQAAAGTESKPRHWFWGSSKVRRFLSWLSQWAFEIAWTYSSR